MFCVAVFVVAKLWFEVASSESEPAKDGRDRKEKKTAATAAATVQAVAQPPAPAAAPLRTLVSAWLHIPDHVR